MRRPDALAAAALALVLTVVAASAAIRLGAQEPALGALRLAHRSAATLEVFLLGALAWLAWRSRHFSPPLVAAIALTVLLSAIGIAAGQAPAPAAAAGNILGGLALAACFAALLARGAPQPVLGMLVVQCALGAWLSLTWRDNPLALLTGHALVGMALLAYCLRLQPTPLRVLLAVAVGASGAAAALFDRAFAPALAHSIAVAFLVAAAAMAFRRAA